MYTEFIKVQRPNGRTGEEVYNTYSKHVTPLLEKMGGKTIWAGFVFGVWRFDCYGDDWVMVRLLDGLIVLSTSGKQSNNQTII